MGEKPRGNPYAIVAKRSFPGEPADAVFNRLRQWLSAERAKIVRLEPPVKIEAAHGKRGRAAGWAKDARKRISFEVREASGGTHVVATVTPAWYNAGDLIHMAAKADRNWRDLLEEAWAAAGGGGGTYPYAAFAPPEWAAQEAGASKKHFRGLLLFFGTLWGMFSLIALTQTLGFYPSRPVAQIMLLPATIGLAAGFWRMASGWSDWREARAHLRGRRG